MYDVERSSEALVCDPYRGPSKEGVANSSITGDTGSSSVNVPMNFVGCSDVISPGEAHRLSLDIISPDVILC